MNNPEPRTPRAESAIRRGKFRRVCRSGNGSCGGYAREAVKALLIANEFLEREMEARVSRGYMRGVRHGRFDAHSG